MLSPFFTLLSTGELLTLTWYSDTVDANWQPCGSMSPVWGGLASLPPQEGHRLSPSQTQAEAPQPAQATLEARRDRMGLALGGLAKQLVRRQTNGYSSWQPTGQLSTDACAR